MSAGMHSLESGPGSMAVPAKPDARDPLAIATDIYVSKPMAAFFRSFELRAYVEAGVMLREPVLDLGCGDGTFGRMLCEALRSNARLTGIDVNPVAVRRSRSSSADHYDRIMCADSRRLPFATGEFKTIIANGSIGCGAGSERGLDEVARILAPGGSLYCTVPTPKFERNYWVVRAAEGLGALRLARRYAHRMNRRITHVLCLDAGQWRQTLASHGLVVQRTLGFFPEGLVTPWSMLAARVASVHALLRAPPFSALAPAVRSLQRFTFGTVFRGTPVHSPPDSCAYLFLHATRVTTGELKQERRDRDGSEPARDIERVGDTESA